MEGPKQQLHQDRNVVVAPGRSLALCPGTPSQSLVSANCMAVVMLVLQALLLPTAAPSRRCSCVYAINK